MNKRMYDQMTDAIPTIAHHRKLLQKTTPVEAAQILLRLSPGTSKHNVYLRNLEPALATAISSSLDQIDSILANALKDYSQQIEDFDTPS